jgi:hypothetical protein
VGGPGGDRGARLEVARGDGKVMYVGSVRQMNTEVRFTVNDTERPGRASTSIAGAFTTRGSGSEQQSS